MNRFQRRLLWWSTVLTAATGGVYAWMKHLMEPLDEWAVINHPLQPLVLKLHILAAPVMVFAVGMVAVNHVWSLYRAGLPRGRRTGIVTAATLGPLTLSGYLIQAVTWPLVLAVLAWFHLALGIAVAGAFVGHYLAVHRGLRRRRGELQVIRDMQAAAGVEDVRPSRSPGRTEGAAFHPAARSGGR